MIRSLLLPVALILAGCEGEADWALAPNDSTPSGPVTNPGTNVAFQGLSEGLPSSPSLSGTAQLNGTLYAVANDGLYSLETGSSKWTLVDSVMKSGETATQVVRIDSAIYMTTTSGLYRRALTDDAFSAVTSAPVAESYVLLKKDGELLMTTSGALVVSKDSGATWSTRSSDPIFSKPVTVFVASPAALRIFCVSDGKLFHSDDSGATWTAGPVTGTVQAISAAGAYVLVQTDSATLRSNNYGNTFHPVDVGGAVASFVLSGEKAFAGTSSGLRLSMDGGATWKDANNGLPAGTGVTQLFLSGAALVASTGSGVYIAQLE